MSAAEAIDVFRPPSPTPIPYHQPLTCPPPPLTFVNHSIPSFPNLRPDLQPAQGPILLLHVSKQLVHILTGGRQAGGGGSGGRAEGVGRRGEGGQGRHSALPIYPGC